MILGDRPSPKASKVLIVYSEAEISHILEVNLAHANLEVFLAWSGAESLQKIRSNKPDILIFDQELLDKESDDINRRIRELSLNIPVILIGNRQKRNDAPRSNEIAVSYIPKPFDPREVVALVQRRLTHKERRNSLQDVDSLQIAMEINLREAREALKNIRRIIASIMETVPPALEESLDRLASDVQEMAVLCNRSLYLAHDFNRRLEMQRDRLLAQGLNKDRSEISGFLK